MWRSSWGNAHIPLDDTDSLLTAESTPIRSRGRFSRRSKTRTVLSSDDLKCFQKLITLKLLPPTKHQLLMNVQFENVPILWCLDLKTQLLSLVVYVASKYIRSMPVLKSCNQKLESNHHVTKWLPASERTNGTSSG